MTFSAIIIRQNILTIRNRVQSLSKAKLWFANVKQNKIK